MSTLVMSPASLYQNSSWSPLDERLPPSPVLVKPAKSGGNVAASSEPESWRALTGITVAGHAPIARSAEAEKFRAAVGARIRELLKYCIEDNEPIVEPESAHGLLQFLAFTHTTRMPLIASDDEGHLVATWKKSNTAMLSLKFLGRSKIEYALAVESDKGKIERDWGDSNWEALLQTSSVARAFLA